MKNLSACIDKLFSQGTVKNIAVRVGKGDTVLFDTFRSEDSHIDEYTLFDMASVSKIIATTCLTLIAFDKGLLSENTKVSEFFETPKDKQMMTVRHLLVHTMGFGHKPLNTGGNTYDNIAKYILSIPLDIPIGNDVLYSCPGFILLGKILEKVFGKRLDSLLTEYVTIPLGMESTQYCPKLCDNAINANPTPDKKCIVNDYNCQFLGGVAGNAGVFSNMHDMTLFAKMMLSKGAPIISDSTFEKAILNYTGNLAESRGLGFLYVDERYAQTGGLFENGSFGHCGHTGQSVFVNAKNGLYVIVLSDATKTVIEKYGKSKYDEVKSMRKAVHSAIKTDLQGEIWYQ